MKKELFDVKIKSDILAKRRTWIDEIHVRLTTITLKPNKEKPGYVQTTHISRFFQQLSIEEEQWGSFRSPMNPASWPFGHGSWPKGAELLLILEETSSGALNVSLQKAWKQEIFEG